MRSELHFIDGEVTEDYIKINMIFDDHITIFNISKCNNLDDIYNYFCSLELNYRYTKFDNFGFNIEY